MTHGFPQNPSPLYRSAQFAIENRPGLEDQTIERVFSELVRLGATTPEGPSRRLEFAKWLSDFHLMIFLQSTGLISPVSFSYPAKVFVVVAYTELVW